MRDQDHCQGCGAPITWAVTVNNKPMPVEPREHGNVRVVAAGSQQIAKVVGPGQGDHQSHFSTCPEARRFRRSR